MIITFELTDKWIGVAGVAVLSEALKTNTTLSKLMLIGFTKGSFDRNYLC